MNTKKRRSARLIMGSLIGLVKPLLPIMILAILLGTAGYLCAIFLNNQHPQRLHHSIVPDGQSAATPGHQLEGRD